jgi:hypothetical protein
MKNHTTILVLALVAALATALVATGIVAIASSAAAASEDNPSGDNTGISIHGKIVQKQKCQTAGGTSPITAACTATGTDTITNSGGVIGTP